MSLPRLIQPLAAAVLLSAALLPAAPAQSQATVVPVKAIKTNLAEESFQTMVVNRALQELGFAVQPILEADLTAAYLAIANGDATYTAVNWWPLHQGMYEKAGGDRVFFRQGVFIDGGAQGYLIDRKTATEHRITNLAQLKDPAIARLFDHDGNGKADLTGCNPGWGCELAIEHQLSAYGLRETVEHRQGNYNALMADTLERFRAGRPILYYTWTPYWVSGVLRPGQEVSWLEVPFTALPDLSGDVKQAQTTLPDGKNYGFPIAREHIVANRRFAQQHPAAAKLFEIARIPIADINAQNLRMQQGENSPADLERHTEAWIQANRSTFDGWLQQARAAQAQKAPAQRQRP